MPDTIDPLPITVMKFALHLLARQEAIEKLMIQHGVATKTLIAAATAEVEQDLQKVGRVPFLDARTSEHDLASLIKTLTQRLRA